MADVQVAMFDTERVELARAPAGLSEQRRRTIRQATALTRGWHPLGLSQAPHRRLRLHPEAAPADNPAAPGRRCGNCWYRQLIETNGNRRWPKCIYGAENETDAKNPGPPPRVTHGAATDVRRWWPACTDHSYGDPRLSEDAARYVPEEST
ncbi:MAG TPA: hypothetical protein VFC00_12525 [Micromonosporaceae bacterium]|nr:hypothetical protein [Micromonosporaceae bacterium]